MERPVSTAASFCSLSVVSLTKVCGGPSHARAGGGRGGPTGTTLPGVTRPAILGLIASSLAPSRVRFGLLTDGQTDTTQRNANHRPACEEPEREGSRDTWLASSSQCCSRR